MINEAKKNKQVTLQLLFFMMVVLSIMILNQPQITTLFMGSWIGFLLYNLTQSVQYRIGKANYLLFPTAQDQFTRLNGIVLGLLVITLSIISSIYFPFFAEFVPIGLSIGTLMLISSLFFVPLGNFKVSNNQLEIYNHESPIEMEQVKEIHLFKDQIIVVRFFGEHIYMDNLHIDANHVMTMENYLSNNIHAAHIEVKAFLE